jgi:hypothetical protein
MNELLYYGGFAIAIALFVMAALCFIIFKVPSIHRYFRKNARKGLVAAEVITGKLSKKEKSGPKRLTRAEYESRTEVITLSQEDTDRIDPNRTDCLAAGRMNTQAADLNKQPISDAERLGDTEIL